MNYFSHCLKNGKKIQLLTLLFFLQLQNSFAGVSSQSFLVRYFDNSVKIESPVKINKEKTTSVVVENNTKGKIYFLLDLPSQQKKEYFSLKEGEAKSTVVTFKDTANEMIYLYPMAPAGKEIALKLGGGDYAIPEKKDKK